MGNLLRMREIPLRDAHDNSWNWHAHPSPRIIKSNKNKTQCRVLVWQVYLCCRLLFIVFCCVIMLSVSKNSQKRAVLFAAKKHMTLKPRETSMHTRPKNLQTACFSISPVPVEGILCSTCVRVVYKHRKTGKTFHHVSSCQRNKSILASSYLFNS